MTCGRARLALRARPPICSGDRRRERRRPGPSSGRRLSMPPQRGGAARSSSWTLPPRPPPAPTSRGVEKDHLVRGRTSRAVNVPPAPSTQSLRTGRLSPGVLDREGLAALRPAHDQKPRELVDRVTAGSGAAEHRERPAMSFPDPLESLGVHPSPPLFDEPLFESARSGVTTSQTTRMTKVTRTERAERVPEHLDRLVDGAREEQRRPMSCTRHAASGGHAHFVQRMTRRRCRARATALRQGSARARARLLERWRRDCSRRRRAQRGRRRPRRARPARPGALHPRRLGDGHGFQLARGFPRRPVRRPQEERERDHRDGDDGEARGDPYFGGGGIVIDERLRRLVGFGNSSIDAVERRVAWMLRSTRWWISPSFAACCAA